MREKPALSEEQLRTCFQEQYGLIPAALDFLPRGLDTRAGIYRVMSEQGMSYLLKAKSGSLYEPGCLVPRYLFDRGNTAVVAPLLTRDRALWAPLGDWNVIVYPFIDGDTSWGGMTDADWRETGAIFKRIHEAALPAQGFEGLRKETFDPTNYVRWVRTFESQHSGSASAEGTQYTLRAAWLAHQPRIHTMLSALEKLADVLQKRPGPLVICHADLHQANLIRTPNGQVFVIDWDDVKLAPKERDFIFVQEAPSAQQEPAPFFQGYGPTEIDWSALTYYRYERVVQDLIECADEVFFRDDLGEEARADAVQLFVEILEDGGMIDKAADAATHLSLEFGV